MDRIHVTVLSGFLGAGKTTLLQHILSSDHGLRIAVIVNDMAEINIDGEIVERALDSVDTQMHTSSISPPETSTGRKGTPKPESISPPDGDSDTMGGTQAAPTGSAVSMRRVRPSVVQMQNGCICCTLREDLLEEVHRICQSGEVDYILIESTGISEPLPIAETFTFDLESAGLKALSDVAQLDTMVTVVDASSFHNYLDSVDDVSELHGEVDEQDMHSVSALLVDQIEFANVILLNKTDLVTSDEIESIRRKLQVLNPNAEVVQCQRSKVDVGKIINTGKFNFDAASQHPKWLQVLRGEETPETEEYGISSFVYRRRRPFHPQRLLQLLETFPFPADLIRSKGYTWIANATNAVGGWSHAGVVVEVLPEGYWMASEEGKVMLASMEEDSHDHPDVQQLMADFATTKTILDEARLFGRSIDDEAAQAEASEIGDRRQEIVFIGFKIGAYREEIEKLLDNCLLNNEEMEQKTLWHEWGPELLGEDVELEEENGKDAECPLNE